MTRQADTAYCVECAQRREIADVDDAVQLTPRGEVTVTAASLMCGHVVRLGPETVTGPAPGAPYAGVPAAPSIRLSDVEAVRRRQLERTASEAEDRG